MISSRATHNTSMSCCCRILWKTDFARETGRGVPLHKIKTVCYCNNGKFKRWEDVRFNIEMAYHMVIDDIEGFEDACRNHRPYHVRADSCVVGLLSTESKSWTNAYILGDDFDVSTVPGDAAIILIRLPNGQTPKGSNKLNTYVPANQQREMQKAKVAHLVQDLQRQFDALPETQDDRRFAILQQMQSLEQVECIHEAPKGRFRRAKHHPSHDFARDKFKGFINGRGERKGWDEIPPPAPDEGYVCFYCRNYFKPLHFNTDCPGRKRRDWIDMKRRQAPFGIPANQRRLVPWESPVEAIATADWLDQYGQLWKRY